MTHDSIRKDVGRSGEEIACKFLIRKGYKIITRNYRRKWGEIDIIAEKDDCIRFIEVKAVSCENLINGSREIDYFPEELAHRSKLRKIARIATLYMEEQKNDKEFQIDVVGVIMNVWTKTAHCRLFEQALEDNL